MPEDKSNVLDEIKKKKDRISELKETLNQIDEQKEAWFNKKEEYGKEIAELIKNVKIYKSERDNFTKKVRETKAARKNASNSLKKKFDEINRLKAELRTASKGKKIDPLAIRKNIEHLQESVETEVMSFEKEKKIMKEIRTLKKQFEDSKDLFDVVEKIRKKSKEIEEIKKQANSQHRLVQDHAKHSQEKHEEMIKQSNRIEDLKKKEEEAYKKFFEFKQKFVEVNNELKNELSELNVENKKASKIKAADKKKKRKKENLVLADKEFEINEKIKKKEKLTTEDLLALQQIEMRKTKK